MGQKLNDLDMALYRLVDEILHYKWDPIGVSDLPEARDEYHTYLPVVFSMLKQNKNSEEIANYLTETQSDRMGLSKSPQMSSANLQIAGLLINTRDFLNQKDS